MQKNSERLIYFCHKIIVADVVGSFAPLNMMHLKCAIRQGRYSVAQKIGREGGVQTTISPRQGTICVGKLHLVACLLCDCRRFVSTRFT